MSTATLALRHSEADKPNRALPDDCEPQDDMQTALDIAASVQYAPSTARVVQTLNDLEQHIKAMLAESYAAGRLAGLVAMGGDRGLQS